MTSPVSNSGLDSIYDKKRPSDKPNFSVQLGSLSRFTLFRNCKERGNVLTHTCGLFVLPCDGIAIVRTRKLLFSKCKSPQSRHRDAARTRLFYFSISGAPSSTVNLRLAAPKQKKKDRAIKSARSVLELLTGIEPVTSSLPRTRSTN